MIEDSVLLFSYRDSISSIRFQQCQTLEKEKLKNELENKKESMGKLDYYYSQFLNWVDEFEKSELEERKMIACQLIKQVKVSKGQVIM